MSLYLPRLAIAPASYHSSHDGRSAHHSHTGGSRHSSVRVPHRTYSVHHPVSHHGGVVVVPASVSLSGSGARRGSIASNQGSGVRGVIPPIYPSDSISQRGSSVGSPPSHVYGPVAHNALTCYRGNPSPAATYPYGPMVRANDYVYNPRPTQLALSPPQNYYSPTSAPRSSVTVHVLPPPPPPPPPPTTCHVCGTGMGFGQYPTAPRVVAVPVMMINCPCTLAGTLYSPIFQVLYS
ncbi:hypothetical protein BDZ89DRAFT_574126 [Hymenopellis radicata]|nr:hypothetical protein BDZ89DRAFT_574126 [Hymenopellis radicata]